MEDVLYINRFIPNTEALFEYINQTVTWNDRMRSRKTASFGMPYNYSQITYPYQPIPLQIQEVSDKITERIGFRPNNCLINYYQNGTSKMGFHSDQTDMLEDDTGVVIISLGITRTLRFRNISNRSKYVDFELVAGSLLYMKNKVQYLWQHAILESSASHPRLSLTFRRLKL